jgi:uncharacterized membrane protein YedE/YeeE
MGALIQLAFGALFGLALFSTGAADFDAMERMFLFRDAHLFLLAGMTTLVSAAGLFFLLRSRAAEGIRATQRRVHRGSVPGGVLFGLGWGLSGTCPGTALVQVGSGHVIAIVTLSGILLGNFVFERYLSGRLGLSKDSCS